MKKILVTGANGYVGGHLCARLAQIGWDVRAAVRTEVIDPALEKHATVHHLGDITGAADWDRVLVDTNAVVHLAARVHVIKETAADAFGEYHHVNTDGTKTLARAAARNGVTHFVFLSTVKVHGEHTVATPFSEADAPAPCHPYSVSKWEAERALATIAAGTDMNATILRPPLIYGPGVKGNFLRLLNLVRRRVPLPLASINNSRSFLYAGNLVSVIEKSLAQPVAGVNTFLVSDDHDLSTPQLISLIAAGMNIDARLFRCPLAALLGLSKIIGNGNEMKRMVESLSVDCSCIKRQLQWVPPFTVEQGIRETAQWFLDFRK